MSGDHTPVMYEEAIDLLRLQPGMRVVDATIGCGGHAKAIAERISPGGVLIGLDWDGEALAIAGDRLRAAGCDVRLRRRNFGDLEKILEEEGIGEVDALLFDVGASSLQIESGERGFSFSVHGPLDMRMDRRRPETAGAILSRCGAREMERLFAEYGEEELARPIARAIAGAGCPEDTLGLAEIVSRVYARTGRRSRINPATKVFQALRIAVNDELRNLRLAIPQAIDVAKSGGRIVVISFHSLEDRIVKEEFLREAKGCVCPHTFPVCRCGRTPRLKIITKRVLRPSEKEVASNPRARSARLRAAEKI
ncbi:MAG: 16S rRNA (cytosine(1402)-N(4))-methyltransferase RsmH [bacterium]